jgi:hypothetical protein
MCSASVVGAEAAYHQVSEKSPFANSLSLRGDCANPHRCEFPSTASACFLPANNGQTTKCNVGASDFDFGGPEVAYHDSTPWNEAQSQNPSQVVFPRSPPDWVDVSLSAPNGLPSVGYTVAGEWVGYSRLLAVSDDSNCTVFSNAGISVTYSNGAASSAVIDVYLTTFRAKGKNSSLWIAEPEVFAGTIQLLPTGSWTTYWQSAPLAIDASLPSPMRNVATAVSVRLEFPNGGVSFSLLSIDCTCSSSASNPTPPSPGWDSTNTKTIACAAGGAVGLALVLAVAVKVVKTRRRGEQKVLLADTGLQ